MARIRFYVATSLDGFIADRDGSVDWMAPYDARLYGYDRFLSEVGAVVMGRRTFEMINATGEDWPYAGLSVFVLSSEPLSGLPRGVATSGTGMLSTLQRAREATQKDIWVMGGATALQSALEDGLIDLVEIFLVPVLLGSGLTLLNDLRRRQSLVFDGIEAFPDGVVKLRYILPKRAKPSPAPRR
jgi:dihydrofolate reductase